ncbi:MAG: hypothetical protein ABSF21_05660 [Dehalococcoidia bacterium]
MSTKVRQACPFYFEPETCPVSENEAAFIEILNVGIIDCGQMGGEITQVCAQSG